MSIYEVLEYLCIKKGVKITNVEKELGFSKGSLSKLKKSTPTTARVFALAEYFNVSSQLLLDASQYNCIDDIEIKLRELKETMRREKRICDYGSEVLNMTKQEKAKDLTEDYEWCFMCGDSMLPELKDGDQVKVHLQTVTETTDLTVVKVGAEQCTVKYVEIVENGVWLRALNKSVYDDHFYSVQQVIALPISIIGKVIELRRQY